jgi:hypothetical protein
VTGLHRYWAGFSRCYLGRHSINQRNALASQEAQLPGCILPFWVRLDQTQADKVCDTEHVVSDLRF